MNDVTIRAVKETDLPELARVYCKVYEQADVGENWEEPAAQKLLSYFYSAQPDLSFLAEQEGRIVGGFLASVKPWWDGNHLVEGEVFVDPECQASGIGTELSKTMYRTAKDKHAVTHVEWITFRNKEHPLKWYESQGFTEMKDWTIVAGCIDDILKNLEKLT